MKRKCFKCNSSAVWRDTPCSKEDEKYFCDNRVKRGCSCNLIGDSLEEEYTDEQGRLSPCCEYDYNLKGFSYDDDEDLEMELWDQTLLDGLELEDDFIFPDELEPKDD